ncbi:MAG: ATPase, T2SS/T4P/T4SS family [Actinomycetota bacterium]|nr:ATPase, T2SS/T4P/T4SS family [Actinomycetota bacterium]
METGASVTAHIEAQVRAAIRRLGIDPMRDPEGIREVISGCLADYLARSTPADSSPMVDPEVIAQQVHHAVAGFGPLQQFFDDPTVEELWINEPGRVFIARDGRSELTTVVLTDSEVRDLVERMLRVSGRRLDLSNPFVDAMLPDGSRLHVAIPDITRTHWAINIRRFVVAARHVHDLVAKGTLNMQAADFLEAAVISGLNVVVAGGTQAGKTTFLNALLGCVPSNERIVSCEEVFEIKLSHPDWVPMQTRDASLEGTGEVPLRRLVREALRMRPTRLVVGEVRQAEALDLLVAMNSGMPSMATLHANSGREAIIKLCTLPLLAGQNISGDFVVPTVAGCVDIVVHLATDHAGARRVREIIALPGRVENGVVEIADIFVDLGTGLQRAGGYPPHPERFARRGFDLTSLLESPVDLAAARGRAA